MDPPEKSMSDMNRRDFGKLGFATLTLGGLGNAALHARAQTADGRAYRYIHLDVFTDKRMQGNQLFVFTQPAGLDTETMQTMTRESNLSECTFVFPPELTGGFVVPPESFEVEYLGVATGRVPAA